MTETKQKLQLLRDKSNPFSLLERSFVRQFRFTRSSARNIIDQLLEHNTNKMTIPFELQFLSSMNFFAKGSYQSSTAACFIAPMSRSSVSRALSNVVGLIEQHIISEAIKFPKTLQEQQETRLGFYQKFKIPGVIGCIDGSQIAISNPPMLDANQRGHLFRNRKGFFH